MMHLSGQKVMSNDGPPCETVTFLFTDIVASTWLWDQDPRSMSQALDRHDTILERAAGCHLGFVLTSFGDGFSIGFADPVEAVRAAVEGQQEIIGEVWPTPQPLAVRMAIHTGAAERKNGTYTGRPLNRTARILALARGGEILVSHTTRDLAIRYLDGQVGFSDLGPCRLRGISDPERIYRVELLAT